MTHHADNRRLSTPPMKQVAQPQTDVQSSNIVPLHKNSPEPRVLEQNTFDGSMTGQLTDNDKPNDGTLTAAFFLVRDLLNQQTVIDHATHEQGDEGITILTGALHIARYIVPGETASVTALINHTTEKYPQFSYRLLTDKCKPALIHYGVLLKIHSKKYRWATMDELQLQLKEPAADSNTPKTTPPLEQLAALHHALKSKGQVFYQHCHPQKLIDAHQRRKAARDIWRDVLPDGSIQKHRKPFTGEYTAEEKKASRDAYKRAAYGKLVSQHQALTPAAKELAEQKQLEAIERQATQAAQMDTLKMWGKVIAVIGAVLFIISTLGNKPQPITPINPEMAFMPSGIHGGSQ